MAVNNLGPRKSGSGFTNLQKILKANKNNKLGTTLISGVGGAVDKAKGSIAGAQGKFQGQLDESRQAQADDKSFKENLFGRLDSSPTSVGKEDIDKFLAIGKAQYEGPTGIQEPSQLTGQADEAEGLGNLAGSRGGRVELLRRFATQGSRPQYTRSKQALDELYLAGSGDQLNQIRRSSQGIGDKARSTINLARAAGDQNARAFTEQQGKFKQDLESKQSADFGSANQRLRDAVSAKNQAYQAKLNSFDPQAMATLGVTTKRDDLYGVSPFSSRYYQATQDPTISNISSPEERAKLAALQQLSGKESTIDMNAAAYDPNNIATFDAEGFHKGVKEAQIGYNNAAQPIMDQITALQRDYHQLDPVGKMKRNAQIWDLYNQMNKVRSSRGMSSILPNQEIYGSGGTRTTFTPTSRATAPAPVETFKNPFSGQTYYKDYNGNWRLKS